MKIAFVAILAMCLSAFATEKPVETLDLDVIARIRDEGFHRFAAPQADANGAPGLEVECAQDAHGLKRDDGSPPSSVAPVPAIQLSR
jgi:hypothetical protein